MKIVGYPQQRVRPVRGRGVREIALCVAFAIMVLAASACGVRVEPDAKTRDLIDEAITKITNQSADWQTVIQETLNKLPKDAPSFVRTELSNLVRLGAAATGGELRCDIDFLGQRALQRLVALRSYLLGQPTPPIPPTICSANPPFIDMALRNQDPNRIQAIDLYGYDFDTKPPLQVLLTDNGEVRDVTQGNLTHPSHYEMIINLGANGIKLAPTSQLISLAWNGAPLGNQGEIKVIQPDKPPCPIRQVFLDNVGVHEVRASLDHGDAEFGTNRPDVSVNLTLTNRESHVDADLSILAVERNRGDTQGSWRSVFSIYTAPTGWRVLRVVTPTSDAIGPYADTTWEVDRFPRGGDLPVSLFEVWGDTAGPDVEPNRDDGTRVLAHFRRVQVEIVQTVDCK